MRQSRRSLASASVLRAGDAAKAGVVELRLHRFETRLDLTQALAAGQLREGQAKELIVTAQAAAMKVAAIAADASVELVPRQKVQQLREHHPTGIHRPSPSTKMWLDYGRKGTRC